MLLINCVQRLGALVQWFSFTISVMSRFFATSSSSETEETSSSNDEFLEVKERRVGLFEALSLSEDEGIGLSEEGSEASENESVTAGQPAAPVRKSRFMFETESESSEEESFKGQIKSQKEKIQDELENLADALEAGLEEKEWVDMQDDFDRLIKLMSKHRESLIIPASVYSILPTLEEAISKYAAGSEHKTLNAVSAKAFNALRQKVRKAVGRYEGEIERAQRIRDEKEESVNDHSTQAAAARVANRAIFIETIKASTELTPDTLLKRLHEIISMRGKKHVDKTESINVLRKMISISTNRRHTIQVMVALLTAQFEMSTLSGYIQIESWNILLTEIGKLIDLLESNAEELQTELLKEEEDLGLPSMTGLRGSLISYTQRLDDEFIKALQNIDPHSNEYIEFLRTEPRLFAHIDRCRLLVFGALSGTNNTELVCQLAARQLEHIYYKPHRVVVSAFKTLSTVLSLCGSIYTNGNERQKVRALLCHIYWLAIHNEYTKARDLMLQSHIQDALSSIDISSQVLYNRTLVQVGLAAFRQGHFKETYFALQELCSTGRPKELLAQGLVGQKYTEKAEMDRAERSRLIPFHMQINVEMIDCVFLTVAMLLELPQNVAASRRYFSGERRLFQSRHLRRILDSHDRNLFNGPPENTREYIVAAAKALANGQWRICEEHMMRIKIWDTLNNPVWIRRMLCDKIREAALLSFLFANGPIYLNLSIEYLVKEFDLPRETIICLVKSLLSEYGVPALFDNVAEQASMISFSENSVPSPMRELTMQLMDKIHVLEERNNECGELLNSLYQLQMRNQRHLDSHPAITS